MESVDLVGLGHNRVLGLDVAFRHCACAAAVVFLCNKGKAQRARAQRGLAKGRGERERAFSGPEVGETGLWDLLYVSMPGKGLGGTLDCRRGPKIEAAGDNSENKCPVKVELRRVIGVLCTADRRGAARSKVLYSIGVSTAQVK